MKFLEVNAPSFLPLRIGSEVNACLKKKEGAENKCRFYVFLHVMIIVVNVKMINKSRRCMSQSSEPCHQRSDRSLQLGRVKLANEKGKLAETIIPSLMSKQI